MSLEIRPIAGIPEIRPGDDLAAVLAEALEQSVGRLLHDDVLVVTHKIVSKAEGRIAPVNNDADYRATAESEAADVLRKRGDLVITRTQHGFICANSGVDRSNVEEGWAILLPEDPDSSAHGLRVGLERHFGIRLGVVVSDTFGRAWRRGQTDVAIGISGIDAVVDLRGSNDQFGRTLTATEVAIADEIAAAADLVMGKAAMIPAALVRGLAVNGTGRASELVRPPSEDLFL